MPEMQLFFSEIQNMHHGLTLVMLCVLIPLADNTEGRFIIV